MRNTAAMCISKQELVDLVNKDHISVVFGKKNEITLHKTLGCC